MKEGQEKLLNGVGDPRGWGSNNKIWRAPLSSTEEKGREQEAPSTTEQGTQKYDDDSF